MANLMRSVARCDTISTPNSGLCRFPQLVWGHPALTVTRLIFAKASAYYRYARILCLVARSFFPSCEMVALIRAVSRFQCYFHVVLARPSVTSLNVCVLAGLPAFWRRESLGTVDRAAVSARFSADFTESALFGGSHLQALGALDDVLLFSPLLALGLLLVCLSMSCVAARFASCCVFCWSF